MEYFLKQTRNKKIVTNNVSRQGVVTYLPNDDLKDEPRKRKFKNDSEVLSFEYFHTK